MCPLYPLHLIFSWGFLILFLWIWGGQSLASVLEKKVSNPHLQLLMDQIQVGEVNINEGEQKSLTIYIDDIPPEAVGEIILKKESEDEFSHIDISPDKVPLMYDSVTQNYTANTSVSGSFLGFSKIKFILSSGAGSDGEHLQHHQQELREVRVKVHRETTTLDKIFIHVVILLVLIAYINMGCAIDLQVIKETLKRPVAPAIGLASQYLFMPLVSFGIGYLLFPSRQDFWLGLFLTGCAPGGGGSNMWTYVLEGSLDLSITMTFLSTLFAFLFLPLWVYALGPIIFADGYYGKLPYKNIAMLVFGMVVPCCIGLLIRRFFPKAADFLKKMLKPLSILFIIFIMTFGVYAKFYLFSYFTWKVAVAGFCLPFFGFVFGGFMALLMKRKWEDVIAISIETGVQNTGLAIGVIKIALGKFSPLDDIAIVLPVAVATMTPIPLFFCFIAKYLRNKRSPKMSFLDKFDDSSVAITNIQCIKEPEDTGKNLLP